VAVIRSGKFEKFDYGWLGNIVHYRQGTPPQYDLAGIPSSTNMFLVSGGQDALADSSDVQRLQGELTCQVQSLVLPSYGHADFVLGTQAYVDVYNPVIQYFRSLD
jgi:lysosomal acid lipase/cholesteryl ester hydrolase